VRASFISFREDRWLSISISIGPGYFTSFWHKGKRPKGEKSRLLNEEKNACKESSRSPRSALVTAHRVCVSVAILGVAILLFILSFTIIRFLPVGHR